MATPKKQSKKRTDDLSERERAYIALGLLKFDIYFKKLKAEEAKAHRKDLKLVATLIDAGKYKAARSTATKWLRKAQLKVPTRLRSRKTD